MQTKTCPDCQDDIHILAKSHKCGWREEQGPKERPTKYVDRQRNRCAWVSGERCRYIGTMMMSRPYCGETVTGNDGKPHAVFTGDLYCQAHAFETDPAMAQRIVEASVGAVSANFDYSSQALATAIRKRFPDFAGDAERAAIEAL